MIVRPHPRPFSLLFIIRGSIIGAILGELAAVAVIALLVVVLHRLVPSVFSRFTLPSVSVLGLAISIFLGFRANVCYQRWWEARCQWGHLIGETRAFLRDAQALLGADEVVLRRLGHRLIAFAHTLKADLRQDSRAMAQDWLSPGEWQAVAHRRGKADRILALQAEDLAGLLREGRLSDILYRGLADRLDTITGIQAACERLHTTPTPFAYTLLLHRTAWLFCLLLPFGLVSTMGFATPIVTVIVAYAFFGLDALGQELQQPFDERANALPLDALVRVIEISVL